LRRDITKSGLFWDLFVALGVMGLIAAIIGLAVAPARAATACVTLGVVSIVVLASYVYRHRRQVATAEKPVGDVPAPGPRLTNAQYRGVEALWVVILVAAVIATVATDGSKGVAFGVPTAMAIAALAILETRRRRDVH